MTSLSLDQLKQAVALKEQIAALDAELETILGGGEMPPPVVPTEAPRRRGRPPGKAKLVAENAAATTAPAKTSRGGPRIFSPESRARMAAAQKARWARFYAGKRK